MKFQIRMGYSEDGQSKSMWIGDVESDYPALSLKLTDLLRSMGDLLDAKLPGEPILLIYVDDGIKQVEEEIEYYKGA